MLHELEQNAIHRRRMNKSDQATTRTHARSFVNQPRPFALQVSQHGMDVGNFNGNVMHSRPPPGEKLSDGRFGSERLEQFHVTVAHRQHAHLHALLGHLLGGINLQAERVAPDCQPVFDAFSGDSDVIYLQQL